MTQQLGKADEMRLEEWPLRALAATLDIVIPAGAPFETVPLLWHWLYFLKTARRRELGADGHPADPSLLEGDGARGERRMFGAGRVEFHRPLCIGDRAQTVETAMGSRRIEGKSGPMRIVTFEQRYLQAGKLCIREERDIVYLPAIGGGAVAAAGGTAAPEPASPEPAAPEPAAPTTAPPPDHSRTVTPDAAMLFRFSALTFNAHRIHYDQHYAQVREGHAERVVHGTLTAILLAELLRERGIAVRRFEFRARRPLFVDAPIRLTAAPAADRITLRAIGPDGRTAMEAQAFR